MRVLSLFSGIGGLDLGLERAGMIIAGQVEIDPWCRKVLAKHWPEVSKHDDVRTCAEWWRGEPRPAVPDVIAAGFPCQPVSNNGRKMAQDDPRWLWPATSETIGSIRPGWVIIENVPGLRTRGLATVLGDLARHGYRARAGTLTACAMGAPHTRERLFVVAHSGSLMPGYGHYGAKQVFQESDQEDAGSWRAIRETDHWNAEPSVGRVANGVPSGVDRLRGLGNAVVPQAGEHIGRLVMHAARAPHYDAQRTGTGYERRA